MKDDIGDRMKKNYENRSKTQLLRRMPVIVRLDGKGFSKFCKSFEKPFDNNLHLAFNETILFLCSEISGVAFAEHHSDEISLLLIDYQKLNTEAYFDYDIQKICSTISGMATANFCKCLFQVRPDLMKNTWPSFDCRCFNIPKEEVENYFWWRNKDSVRNSIQMFGQNKFSHKELINKNCNQIQEMLFQIHGLNWNDIKQEQKTGFYFIKNNGWETIPGAKNREELSEIFKEKVPLYVLE